MKHWYMSWVAGLAALVVLAVGCHGAEAIEKIQVRAVLAQEPLVAGSSVRVAVVLDIAPPWHVNANPVTVEGLIPTTLRWEPLPGIEWLPVNYPPGRLVKVGWADQAVALYEGRVVLVTTARVSASAPIGPVTLQGQVRYQACDDEVCYAPQTVPIRLAATIAPAGSVSVPSHSDVFAQADAAMQPQANRIEEMIRRHGWALALVLLFLGGLALNLTPCVYPMIAITVGYFGSRESRSVGAAFRSALLYFFGVVVTYSALGLVAALTGGLFGALLQHPVVLLTIAAVLVAMALSLFGLYEIRPPQFLLKRAAGLSGKAGWVGLFFMGAMVGVIAAPCLAPILVALLVYVGQRGDPWLGWWLFFVLACGLGAPYVVLGTFSGLLNRLPKAGAWMVRIRQAFGVVLLAVAVWLTMPLWPHRASRDIVGWQPYSPAAVEAARLAGRPVIIDFAADWCLPCKELERYTFRDPRVAAKMREFVTLKADLTQSGSPAVEELRRQFGVVGVPTIVFLDATGRERRELRQEGFVRPEQFLKLLEAVQSPAPAS